MTLAHTFEIHVEQIQGFAFRVRFDDERLGELTMDEPPPLGTGSAPSASRVLAAAIGNCLAASLVFCMRRSGVTLDGLRGEVHVELVRNERKRLRIGKVGVRLHAAVPPEQRAALHACRAVFEDFCTVTQSVRQGIDIDVDVDVMGGSDET